MTCVEAKLLSEVVPAKGADQSCDILIVGYEPALLYVIL
jgi:hypothetical protein